MKIEIKSSFTGTILFSHDADNNSVATTLEAAVRAKADLSGANLHGAYLRGAYLRGAYLHGANLYCADLYCADLSRADLRGADLRGADLRAANLRAANLRGANLHGADLYDADLRGADLRGANLDGVSSFLGACGNMREVKSLQCDKWPVTYTATHMQIGCQLHAISEWFSFNDERIVRMDFVALKWWRKWKPLLQAIIHASPAEPTSNA